LDLSIEFGHKSLTGVIEDEDIVEAYESFLGEVIDVEWPGEETSYNLYIQLKNLIKNHPDFGRYHSF